MLPLLGWNRGNREEGNELKHQPVELWRMLQDNNAVWILAIKWHEMWQHIFCYKVIEKSTLLVVVMQSSNPSIDIMAIAEMCWPLEMIFCDMMSFPLYTVAIFSQCISCLTLFRLEILSFLGCTMKHQQKNLSSFPNAASFIFCLVSQLYGGICRYKIHLPQHQYINTLHSGFPLSKFLAYSTLWITANSTGVDIFFVLTVPVLVDVFTVLQTVDKSTLSLQLFGNYNLGPDFEIHCS